MRRERTIGDTTDHVVICGYGIFGQTIADRLRETDRDVVVESDEAQHEVRSTTAC